MASPADEHSNGHRPLSGKVVLVTGGNSGLGKATASELARRGATVYLGCRNSKSGNAAVEDIRDQHKDADVRIGPPLDLASLDSVRSFAAAWDAEQRPLHILVNNAGTNYDKEEYTPEGVGITAQINYLGPYTLTRCLERTLQGSAPSRVVNVSSVMHRFASLRNARDALFVWKRGAGDYSVSKLNNALFAYELQRRLGKHGVQAAAVDPGGSYTSIYRQSRIFSRGPLNWIMRVLYSPPSEGAHAIIHACTDKWDPATAATNGADKRRSPTEGQLRFYGRGLFARPPITWAGGPYSDGLQSNLRKAGFGAVTLVLSVLDNPLRLISGGRLMAESKRIRSSQQSYDPDLARSLWDLSADTVGLPREPQLELTRTMLPRLPCTNDPSCVLLGISLARQTLRTLPSGLVPAPQQPGIPADAAAHQLQTRTMKARERCVQPDMDSEVHIVYASCGGGRISSKVDDLLVSLYSVYIHAHTPGVTYCVHIITDGSIEESHVAWLAKRPAFQLVWHKPFPNAPQLFDICATERLFVSQHAEFQELNSVIYIDSDTIWLEDPYALWSRFWVMPPEATIGIAAENIDPGTTCDWYPKSFPETQLPYPGKWGVNSGIALFRLDRLRDTGWAVAIDNIMTQWAGKLRFGDQCVLNLYLAGHMRFFYELPCEYNYRYMCVVRGQYCPAGPKIYHGNGALRHREQTTEYKTAFEALLWLQRTATF